MGGKLLCVLMSTFLVSCSGTENSDGDDVPTMTKQTNNFDYSETNIPAECQDDVSGHGFVHFTISGGATCDGSYDMCVSAGGGAYGNMVDIDTGSYNADPAKPDEKLRLILTIPEKQYHGPGTYDCGHENNISSDESRYCSIQLEHHVGEDQLMWNLTNALEEGPHPNCSITLDNILADGVSGSFDCQDIGDRGIYCPHHPNAGVHINISGTFEAMPL